MNIGTLTKLEFKLLRRELEISLQRQRYIVSYLIIAITCISIYNGIWLFFKMQNTEIILKVLKAPTFNFGLQFSIPFLLVLSLLRGVSTDKVISIFSKADSTILFPRPIKFQDIYISKLIINAFKHASVLVVLFLSIFPIFINLELNYWKIFSIYFYCLLLIETSQVLSHLEFFILNSQFEGGKHKKLNKNILLVTFVILVSSFLDLLITKSGFNIFYYRKLLINSPEIMLSLMIGGVELNDAMIKGLAPTIILFLVLIFCSYFYAHNYERMFHNSSRALHDRIFGLITFRQVFDSKISWLFQKDVLILLRTNGVQLLVNLILTYSFSVAIIYHRDIIYSLVINRGLLSSVSLLIIIYLKLILAPTDPIDNEWGSYWLIRSSNVSKELFFNSKTLFYYIISTPFILPLLRLVFIMDKNTWISQLVIIINLVFLFYPLKFLSSTIFYNDSNSSIDLFLSNFFQFLFILTFWIIFTSFENITISMMFLYSTILISLFVTKYGKPIKYYVLELISNIYFFTLVLAGFIGAIMIIIALIRTSLIMNNWISIILRVWSILITCSTSFLLNDYIMKWTIRLYSE